MDVEDLDKVDPLIMAGVTIVENLCLEARGDHQFMVEDSLTLPKEMEIAFIVANMVTLKESVIKSKMSHREVEDVAGFNSLTFIKEEDNMVVQEAIEEVTCLLCSRFWTA